MINTNEIKGRIMAKGYTQAEVARMIGIAPDTLSRKLIKGVLGTDEVEKLVKVLEIENPWEIFFAKE
jgi:transcriptional regulator with XRE-family HTH domain